VAGLAVRAADDIRALATAPAPGAATVAARCAIASGALRLERRYSNDLGVASKMNGIDFGKYEIAPNHVCCGLFPAGKDDPYFIDRGGSGGSTLTRSLLTRAQETARSSACGALLPAVGPAGAAENGRFRDGGAALAAIRNWLATQSPASSGQTPRGV